MLSLSIPSSFSFSFNHVTIASIVSLVAHSPRPDMLSLSLLTLQLYNGHGHGTLNGRGYPLVRYIVTVLPAIPYLYYTGIAEVENSLLFPPYYNLLSVRLQQLVQRLGHSQCERRVVDVHIKLFHWARQTTLQCVQ